MSDKAPGDNEIPVLQDVVVPVSQVESKAEANEVTEPSLLSSTLQQEVEAIINRARADFDATIEQALKEMQQRVERELNELHIHLTKEQ